MKTVIIQGSARSNGNTRTVIDYLNKNRDFDIIDLKTKNIGHFDYDFSNANDDFIPLMEHIVTTYDVIIFATPVYWYSMSGILKTFLDRVSDLLKTHKHMGRLLRGKHMGMISNSGENDLKEGFTMPFYESAQYLGMQYIGNTHAWFDGSAIDNEAKKLIDIFRSQIKMLT
jgi:multimeric flavodoxin WrbA